MPIGVMGLPILIGENGINSTILMPFCSLAVGQVGGNCRNGLKCGLRNVNLNDAAGTTRWNIGAANITFLGIDGTISLSLSAVLVVNAVITLAAAFAPSRSTMLLTGQTGIMGLPYLSFFIVMYHCAINSSALAEN